MPTDHTPEPGEATPLPAVPAEESAAAAAPDAPPLPEATPPADEPAAPAGEPAEIAAALDEAPRREAAETCAPAADAEPVATTDAPATAPVAPEPAPEPEPAPAPAASEPAPRRGGALAGAFAGLLGGAAAAAALAYAAVLPPPAADPGPLLEAQARLQAAESRIKALESRPEPAPPPSRFDEVDALANRVGEVERAAQALARLDARLAALEAQPRQDSAPAAQAPAPDERIPALQERAETAARTADEAVRLATTAGEAAQRAAAAVAPMPDRLAAAEKKLADLSGLPNRVVALDQRLQLAAQPSRMIAWPVALGVLHTAIDQGRPFRAELDAAVALSGPGYERLKAIDGEADKGIPTLRAVQARFEQVTSEVLSAVPRSVDDDAGVLERLARNAEGLVRFKPAAPVSGDTPAAVISRAEAQLGRGDLAGAIATVNELPPDLVKLASPWLTLAKTRLDADRLLAGLTAEALAALARAGG